MEQAWQTSFAIVDHIAGDLKTTPRVGLSEIWYKMVERLICISVRRRDVGN
jgi:hypothetical protein